MRLDNDGPASGEPRLEIEMQDSDAGIPVDEVRGLRRWLAEVVSAIAPEANSLGVKLTDDATMQEVNLRYRGIDKSTDVLSFSGGRTREGTHLGDILISAPFAARQASARGMPLYQELQTLLIHGILHCLGYDHESDDGTMERLEREDGDRWINDTD
jgi:probable rRNA maturation factor